MEIIRTTKVEGLVAKLTRTYIGAVNDNAEVSLLKCDDGMYNVAVNHPAIRFENSKNLYLFPEPVSERIAMDEYNKLINDQNEKNKKFSK